MRAAPASTASAPSRPSPFELDRAKKAASRPPEPQSLGANALASDSVPVPIVQAGPMPTAAPVEIITQHAPASAGDWRQRLHAALMELGMPFTADAIENARVIENGGELQVFTTKAFSLALKPDDLTKAIRHLGERVLRPRVIISAVGAMADQAPAAPLAVAPSAAEDEATARALANPEVQRFREVFGGEIRKVRNLKE
jgi:hypothetical protein